MIEDKDNEIIDIKEEVEKISTPSEYKDFETVDDLMNQLDKK